MNKLLLKNAALTATLVSCLVSPTFASEPLQTQSKQQEQDNLLIGLGAAGLAGAAVAGPVGLLVGGMFGLFVAEDTNQRHQEDYLTASLENAESRLEQTEAEYLALQQAYQENLLALQQMKAQQPSVQLAAMPRETVPVDLTELLSSEANIQFKTASWQLPQHYTQQLDTMAAQLKADPKLLVQLFGYADRRGDETYNLELSEKRAEQIKRYLVSVGVNSAQIETAGYGEA